MTAEVVAELKILLSAERVFWREDSSANKRCWECALDKSTTHPPRCPDAVVEPETAEEVAAVVKLCAQKKIIVVARGAGTGLEGGAIAYMGGVVCEMMRMKSFSCSPTDFMATVGPGWLKNDINAKLKEFGLFFGPDPSSNPSVGGMASTGGSGMTTLKYGTTKENLVSLKVPRAPVTDIDSLTIVVLLWRW